MERSSDQPTLICIFKLDQFMHIIHGRYIGSCSLVQIHCVCMHHSVHTNIMPFSNMLVQESFSLADGRQWLKGVTKGDSMLFMCKLKDDNRRFRVKFAATAEQASLQTCRSCCDVLEAFFPIKDVSNVPTETTKSLSQYVMTDVNTQQTTGSRSTLDVGRQCFSQQPVSMETSKNVLSFTVPEKQLSGPAADTMATIVADVREIPLSTTIGVESGPYNSEDHGSCSSGKLKTTSQILQVHTICT